METSPYLDLIEDLEVSQRASADDISAIVYDLLIALGEDPQRPGLQRTPERVSRMFGELLSGYQTDLETLVNGALFESDYQGMVVVRDIEFYSLCEHHLLPFFGKAHVAYVPDGRIIGLSKIPRLVEMFARRLQVQEHLTQEIAEALEGLLKPKGVAVVIEGAHMCAMMRGVKKDQANMATQTMRGVFETDERLRQEFLSSIYRR